MFVWALLLFESLAGAGHSFVACLQPGHVNHEYDSVEEVKEHNFTTTENVRGDEHLIKEAVLDVAYYLRRFKFAGFDPRYLVLNERPQQNLFVQFPNPRLRNIHWEVKKNCEPSFVECVKYLQEQVSQTILPRHLDSLTITRRNGWSLVTDEDLIKSADDECLKLLEKDENASDVFSGPLQRFQWLASASYYMCWYAMKENRFLRTFSEDCDDFAACISWKFGPSNKDVRANNKEPFACAQYSFCPDPCCPLKHISDKLSCQDAGPCSGSKVKECVFLRENNVRFEALVLNQWNLTCHCDEMGMRWESRSGMCVDINECLELKSPCDYPSESCKNLPGTFICVCNMLGYRNNDAKKVCEDDDYLQRVLHPPRLAPWNKTVTKGTVPLNAASAVKSVAATALGRIARKKPSLNRTKVFGDGLNKSPKS